VGASWAIPESLVSSHVVAEFAASPAIVNPLANIDEGFANRTRFGRPIVHGLLVLSTIVGHANVDPRSIVATVGFPHWFAFRRPVYVGERSLAFSPSPRKRHLPSGGLIEVDLTVTRPMERLLVAMFATARGARITCATCED